MSSEDPLDPELPSPADAAPAGTAVLVIAAGGVLGASARAGMTAGYPAAVGSWPWMTLTVNTTGAFAIGAVMAFLIARRPSSLVRLFLCTGVLGGYTTFSAFTVEAVTLVDDGRPLLAAAYVSITMAGAVLACHTGLALGRRMFS